MYYIKGIDVSRWQGIKIKWDDVKADGYQFVFIKVTDGSAYKQQFIDVAKIQATDASKAKLKIGFYHFAHPTNHGGLLEDARSEANYFLKTIKSFPKPDLPMVLDLEDEKINLSPQEVEQWVNEFKRIIEEANYTLIIYSYAAYLNLHLPKKLNGWDA